MPVSHLPIDRAIESIESLRKSVIKGRSSQVTSVEERGIAKATSLAWFREQSSELRKASAAPTLEKLDRLYDELQQYSERAITRKRYKSLLRELKRSLVALRSTLLVQPALPTLTRFVEPPADYTRLVPPGKMIQILEARWRETQICLREGAPLSATVMMGALLEAVILARINSLPDQAPVFTAKSAPRDKQGTTFPLPAWKLLDLISVAHELKWISASAKSIGNVLRDHRNWIHPSKELSSGGPLSHEDAQMFWEVFKTLTNQLLR